MENHNLDITIQEIISEFDLINEAKKDISDFLKILKKRGISNPNIEKYLTGYLLIIFYAETETKLKKILALHSKNFEKKNFSKFLTHEYTSRNMLRSVEMKDLKKTFESIKFSGKSKGAYNTLLNNRHNVAHAGVVNITLAEIEKLDMSSVAKEFITAIQEHLDE